MTWPNSEAGLHAGLRHPLPLMVSAGLAIALGLVQAVSLAWWHDGSAVWWLQLLSLASFLILLRSQSFRTHRKPSRLRWQQAPLVRGFGLSWLFATSWLTGTFWWLFISMHTYGGLAAPLAALAVLALASFLALYYAISLTVFLALLRQRTTRGLLNSNGAAWLAPVALASLWTLAEWARGTWMTGFPWGAIGYAHIDGPLSSLIPWVGVYGVGWVAAWSAAAVATVLMRYRMLLPGAQHVPQASRQIMLAYGQLISVVASLGGVVVLGLLQPKFTEASGDVQVSLLQGNIPQDEKFEIGPGINRSLTWYREAVLNSKAPLVVTAETAIPVLPSQLPEGYLETLREPFEAPGSGQAAIVAIPLGSVEHGYTNSVMAFHEHGKPYTYHKHHLVPFGEFIPDGFRWFVRMMNIPLGDFNRGALPQPPFVWQGERIAPNICYEDLFGEEIGAGFTSEAAAPTILLNLSNIAWFGDSIAIDQHLSISRMRAMEFERPMLRATNTGATALIDHTGRVVSQLPRLTAGVLDVTAQGRVGLTPYARWVSVCGLWPLVMFSSAMVLLSCWVFRPRRANSTTSAR